MNLSIDARAIHLCVVIKFTRRIVLHRVRVCSRVVAMRLRLKSLHEAVHSVRMLCASPSFHARELPGTKTYYVARAFGLPPAQVHAMAYKSAAALSRTARPEPPQFQQSASEHFAYAIAIDLRMQHMAV